MKIIRKIKNNTFAIPAAAPAIPVNPSAPAIRAMIKNNKDHPNIFSLPGYILNKNETPFCHSICFIYI
jgi:hypothetical protein